MTSTSLSLALLVPCLAAQSSASDAAPDPIFESRSDYDAVPPLSSAVPPIPPALNCATSYTRRDVGMDWYDTSDAVTYYDLGDTDIDVFRMPFPFIYFGERYDTVAIADDGYISFADDGSGIPDIDHDPIPHDSAPPGVIAPFWASLDPQRGSTVPNGRYIRLDTYGTEPERTFVITWERFPRYQDPTSEYTFQVALYEKSYRIRFQYLTMTGDQTDMSIGIENEAGTEGYQYARDTPVNLEGRAMEWRPVWPSTDCGPAAPLACGARLVGEAMTGADDLVLYGCDVRLMRASERLYEIELDDVTLVDLQVSPQDGGKTLSMSLFKQCNACDCDTAPASRIRTVLAPGRYYVAVDGPLASDSGPFDLSLDCESLLARVTGQDMQFDRNGCDLNFETDSFADGRAVWTADGWIRSLSDRTYHALRVDGAGVYTTNEGRSSCAEFDKQSSWADDNGDELVTYWQAPEADIIQTVSGKEISGCCGVRIETRIVNRDTIPHYFEFRSLYAPDFGAPTAACVGETSVESGPLHVEPTMLDFVSEQDLSCDPLSVPPGICGVDCQTPAELKSADDLSTQLVVQLFGDSSVDAVRGEWSGYYDVNRICEGEPWLGGFVDGEVIAACDDAAGLLYSWRIPAGTGTLAPGEEYKVIHRFGDGCRLDPACSSCLATADVLADADKLCLGTMAVLDGNGSTIDECVNQGGTVTYDWLRDDVSTGITDPTYTVDEAAAGMYMYELQLSCVPPPMGVPCADTQTTAIEVFDCASCNIGAAIDAATGACVGFPTILDGSASTIANCPGVLTYAWTRDGVPLIDEEGSTLSVTEATEGDHTFDVTVTCEGPPVGLNCMSTSAPVMISFTPGGGMPPDLGNTLKAWKSGSDVIVAWTEAPMGMADSYEILSAMTKLELMDQGSPPPVQVPGLLMSPGTDTDALTRPETQFYRVRGVGCGSSAGPF